MQLRHPAGDREAEARAATAGVGAEPLEHPLPVGRVDPGATVGDREPPAGRRTTGVDPDQVTGGRVPRGILARLVNGMNRVFTGMLVSTDRELLLATGLSGGTSGVAHILAERISVPPRRDERIDVRDLGFADDAFGRIFYAEGDYLHDMDLGFYDAYRYSGGDDWRATASYPPMWYPTHSIGGVLGAMPRHAVSVRSSPNRNGPAPRRRSI